MINLPSLNTMTLEGLGSCAFVLQEPGGGGVIGLGSCGMRVNLQG